MSDYVEFYSGGKKIRFKARGGKKRRHGRKSSKLHGAALWAHEERLERHGKKRPRHRGSR